MRYRNKKKYGLIIAAIIVIVGLTAIFSGGSGSSGKKSGPEGVLASFTSAIACGDFEKAKSLSDTASMQGYMDAYIQRWEELSQKDSAAFASTADLLKEVQISFCNMEEADGICTIEYMIELEGNKRVHLATLRKEEGEWKVVEITDRN